MRVGQATAPLEVPVGTPMGGYVARDGTVEGTGDPLQVGALAVVDDQGTAAVVCVADVLHVDDPLADRARRAVAESVGTQPDLVWLTATHTHAGPQPGACDEAVVAAAVASGRAALEAATEGRVSWHRTELDGVGGQRSGPTRRTTVPLDVLRVISPDGVLQGLVVVVPVHPTVLPATNLLLSADLAGGVRRAVVAREPAVWCLVLTGAAGDVSTRPHRREQTPAEVDRLGGLVADTALARSSAEAVADGPVRGWVESIGLVPADPGAPFRREAEQRARRALVDAEASGDPVRIREATVIVQGVGLSEHTDDGPVPASIAALDLGGVRVLGLGGEPFLSLADTADSAGPAVLVGYANGYCGYLPDRAAYDDVDRQPSYEVLVSRVAPREPERMLRIAASLLR